MKTFISLKDVHRVTYLDKADKTTGIVVDYTDQSRFKSTLHRKVWQNIRGNQERTNQRR